jgi:hypothetical protein
VLNPVNKGIFHSNFIFAATSVGLMFSRYVTNGGRATHIYIITTGKEIFTGKILKA